MKLLESVSRIIAALNEAGLDYMLVGSFSSMYYSFPRSTVALGGDEAWIPTPEDVILQKLIWSRPHDKEDVLGVIAVNHKTLDRKYLDQWSEQLGLTEELAEMWTLATQSSE